MKMTNDAIYTHTRQLMDAFQDGEQRLPIKVNFYLQKNKNTLLALAQDIEKARIEIAQTYGTLDESGEQYQIPEEKLADASKELEDLFNLEQDVNIYTISIDSLSDDLTLTTAQMDAIMFMID
jgi:predicted  nucleic acid-binding Zn-ribbon protein